MAERTNTSGEKLERIGELPGIDHDFASRDAPENLARAFDVENGARSLESTLYLSHDVRPTQKLLTGSVQCSPELQQC